MAALTSTAPFQNALKPCSRRAACNYRRALVVKAQKGDDWQSKVGVPLLAAGLAAATFLGQPSVAEAGVVIEQPKVRKLFQGQGRPKPEETQPSESGGGGGGLSLPSVSLPSVGLPSLPEFSGLNVTPADALDVRSVALPASILAIAGLGYVSYKYDAGFRSMIREGMAKDSTDYAGYEEAVDEYAAEAAGNFRKGTKKISKAANKTAKGAKKAGQKAKGGLFNFGK